MIKLRGQFDNIEKPHGVTRKHLNITNKVPKICSKMKLIGRRLWKKEAT